MTTFNIPTEAAGAISRAHDQHGTRATITAITDWARAQAHTDARCGLHEHADAWHRAATALGALLALNAPAIGAAPAPAPAAGPAPGVELQDLPPLLTCLRAIGDHVDGDPLDDHLPFDDIAQILDTLALITKLRGARLRVFHEGDIERADAISAAIEALRPTLPEAVRW